MKGTRWATMFAACMLVMGVALAAADDKPAKEAKEARAKGGDISATLEANEKAILETIKNKDATGFMALVDKDGMSADMNGFMKADGVPAMMKDFDMRSYDMKDPHAMMVSKDAYLFTYTMTMDGSYKGQAVPPLPTYVSTLYVKRGAKWLGLYHQETMAMPQQDAGAASTH